MANLKDYRSYRIYRTDNKKRAKEGCDESNGNLNAYRTYSTYKTDRALKNFLMNFRKFLSHPATKAVLFIVLLAALAVLTYGLVGIGIAAAVGTTALISTATGGGTALLSSIGLGISFFTSKKLKEEKKENVILDNEIIFENK